MFKEVYKIYIRYFFSMSLHKYKFKTFLSSLFFHATNIVDYKVHLNEENRKFILDSQEKSSMKEDQKDKKPYQIVEHYHFYN